MVSDSPYRMTRIDTATPFKLCALLACTALAVAMSHGRYAFSGITSRAAGSWPGGKRLAVYIKISVEDFPFGSGGPSLVPGLPAPDVMGVGWRDYGNRVGIYRLLEDLERLDLPAAFAVNTMCYETCPAALAAIRASGRHEVRDSFGFIYRKLCTACDTWWQIVGHAYHNLQRQATMAKADEAAMIQACLDNIKVHEGAAPAGWLSPAFSESSDTVDLLLVRQADVRQR